MFNGYDGSRVANFVSQCLTAELLLGQLNSSHSDADIRRILTQVTGHISHTVPTSYGVGWSVCPAFPALNTRFDKKCNSDLGFLLCLNGSISQDLCSTNRAMDYRKCGR